MCVQTWEIVQLDGHTALTLAASEGQFETAKALLAKGAEMEAASGVMTMTMKFGFWGHY